MNDKIQFNIQCDWCKYKGAIYMGHCYGSIHLVKCGKCHHEWQTTQPYFTVKKEETNDT